MSANNVDAQKHINKLVQLVSQGILSKESLPQLIQAVYTGCREKSNKSCNNNKNEKRVRVALKSGKKRASASPETTKVRRLIEVPMQRRFLKQCELEDSVLFGKTKPRKLNQQLFAVAAKSPLTDIFTNHSKTLKNIPGRNVLCVRLNSMH